MSNFRIRLNPRYLSELTWDQWIEVAEPDLPEARRLIAEAFAACEATRSHMAYNTGSITFGSALLLYIAARNIVPNCIFEVGTFIGKSTLAMALAVDHNGNRAQIFTCDGSNDFRLPKIADCQITGFGKTISTLALQQVAATGAKVDFFHFDGRLNEADIDLIERIADPRAVIALDDFEGVEKGVTNLSMLRGRSAFQQHGLLYPASGRIRSRLGLLSRSTTALLVPAGAFTLANQ